MTDGHHVLLASTVGTHVLEWHGACQGGQPVFMGGFPTWVAH